VLTFDGQKKTQPHIHTHIGCVCVWMWVWVWVWGCYTHAHHDTPIKLASRGDRSSNGLFLSYHQKKLLFVRCSDF